MAPFVYALTQPDQPMEPSKKTARTAGLLYLIVVLCGIFSLAYVPSALIEWQDAAKTYTNIQASETLFRLGIVAGIVCYTAFLLLPFVLYKLLQQVDKTHATTMVVLAAASVPFSLYNLVHKMEVLTLVSKEQFLDAIPTEQIQAQVMFQLNAYDSGVQLISVFWGLWLLPFGYLVYKSGFLPKFLGILLMAGCFGYLINFIGGFLFPRYADIGIAKFVSLPATIGEIGICLWLLIAGIKTHRTNEH
jgi:hypothetical protein